MHNKTRLKEPINQIKNELKAGAERRSPKANFKKAQIFVGN
jgi:hypothetical protein